MGTLQEAPDFIHDNEFILSGYRVGFYTTRKIFKSLFMIHNESVNIWSHICGVLMFIALIGYTIIYMAPPGFHGTFGNNMGLSWFANIGAGSEAKRNTFILNDMLTRIKMPSEVS